MFKWISKEGHHNDELLCCDTKELERAFNAVAAGRPCLSREEWIKVFSSFHSSDKDREAKVSFSSNFSYFLATSKLLFICRR